MKDIVAKRYIMKFVDLQENVKLTCPSFCYKQIDGIPNNNCIFKSYKCPVDNKITVNIIRLLVINIGSKILKFDETKFEIVDSNHFSYRPINNFCKSLHFDNQAVFDYVRILPKTQTYYTLYTSPFEKESQLSKIHFVDHDIDRVYQNRDIIYTIDFDGAELESDINQIEKLKIENCKLSEELEDLKKQYLKKQYVHIDSCESSFAIRYRTEEDKNYFYVISEEKNLPVTFTRSFDIRKSNHNWINKKGPLIILKFADVDSTMSIYQSRVESPVSGIFEYDEKEFIYYNEVVCRVKKYSQSQKNEILLELEKLLVKEEILKREERRKLEREAVDELINENLIFSQYTDKYGNSTRVSKDLANAVWNRDGGRCCYCGIQENLQFDHIIPIIRGGATTFENIQILCRTCNIRKSDNIG